MTIRPPTIASLTGVRGVAALWVVFYHLQDAAQVDGRLGWLRAIPAFVQGFRGVDLFFVLSGFILMYVHRADFHELRWSGVKAFAGARFWRVYPLNAAALVLILLLYAAVPAYRSLWDISPIGLVQSFTISQRWLWPDMGAVNGPGWSLSVEVVGYAAFPAMAWLALRLRSTAAVLGLALACILLEIALSYAFGFAGRNVTGRVTLLRMFPEFAAGVLLATALHTVAGHGRALGRLATCSAIACIVLSCIPGFGALVLVPIAGLILGLAGGSGVTNRALGSPIAVWLGSVSFSLYLTNAVVVDFAIWVLWNGLGGLPGVDGPVLAAILVALSLLAAAAVHFWIERPIARLLSRWKAHAAPVALPLGTGPGTVP